MCKLCGTTIKIGNGGLSQVKKHSLTKKHVETSNIRSNNTPQSTLVKSPSGRCVINKERVLMMSNDDLVLQAEIFWALKSVKYNFSFKSNVGNNKLFMAMFPDSTIAKSYKMSETKARYLTQFGIAPWIQEDLKEDLKEAPFSYLFDETTTIQVKKQYDGYVRYESKRFDTIVDRYCGSVFLGHCDADQLVDNFFTFGENTKWDILNLLQLSMDGPRTNKSFKRKLVKRLKDNNAKTIIDIGSCPLHHVHNGYEKALKKLNFDFDALSQDLHFFFKHSSARREDFHLMELLTEVDTDNMLRHVSSRWLSLKKVLNRIIDQWANLRQYFLVFLPTVKKFAAEIEKTDRYQRIRKCLTSPTTKLYIYFAIYLADCLENFLIPFQLSKPMVHVMYTSIGDLFYDLMGNFVEQSVLVNSRKIKKDANELGTVDLDAKGVIKSIHNMDFGTNARNQIGLLESKINLDIIKTEFKMCYIVATKYLQANLPHANKILKDLQYIHPTKVRSQRAVGSIRNLATSIATTLKGSSFTDLSVERYTDLIVHQFKILQAESSKEIEKQTSYTYWCEISKMTGLHDEFKFAELAKMCKTYMCLSHGNAAPERGFSKNKKMLSAKESLDEGTIVALRLTKDFLSRCEDVTQFPICKRILDCATARQKYHTCLEQKQKEDEESLKRKAEDKEKARLKDEKAKKQEKGKEIDKMIDDEKERLRAAETLVKDSNKALSDIINSEKYNKESLVKAQYILDTGISRMDAIKAKMEELNKLKESKE